MRIAITGATGFIGGHLTNRLTGEGHEVVCSVRRGLADVDQLTRTFMLGNDIAVEHIAVSEQM